MNETLEKLIKISKLKFSPEEQKTLEADFAKLVAEAENISAILTTPPLAGHPSPEGNKGILRDDVVEPSFTQEEILANAPETEKGFFVIDKKGMWK